MTLCGFRGRVVSKGEEYDSVVKNTKLLHKDPYKFYADKYTPKLFFMCNLYTHQIVKQKKHFVFSILCKNSKVLPLLCSRESCTYQPIKWQQIIMMNCG